MGKRGHIMGCKFESCMCDHAGTPAVTGVFSDHLIQDFSSHLSNACYFLRLEIVNKKTFFSLFVPFFAVSELFCLSCLYDY